ncbi:mTERF domain-containing protein 1, mitochondrial-like protein [Euroglyphus maynei]|uniref:mTERF domain-containing protein 1, mitochondrial-like protein n=1 Tax=Euroglyphus maynei TaxID=6958 RepID=A0A1Y3B7R7_EURMA|nr:mTERF domain-containing protein 1, mitochondrial-like protein [Euroglyphus maynei]
MKTMKFQFLRLITFSRSINYGFSKKYLHSQNVQNGNELISLSKQLESIPKWNALDKINDDNVEFLNEIRPSLKKSFNLAAYANVSDTLQQLVKLNVNLSTIEKDLKLASFIVRCDFEKDIQPLLMFLMDNGLNISQVGDVLTLNPYLFTIHIQLEDLNTIISYFKFRKFTPQDITGFFINCPKVFSLKVHTIDQHLADLGHEYRLSANEIRHIVRNQTRIILMNNHQLKKCTFVFAEQMGFNSEEIKSLLVRNPRLWTRQLRQESKGMVQSFEYVNTTMKISHEQVLNFPLILLRRVRLIRERHLYLKSLNRDQYDPNKPLYVPLNAFYQLDDSQFCIEYAKTCIDDFNRFLKTI